MTICVSIYIKYTIVFFSVCIPPLPLANGTVVVSINKSIVTYSCEPGFTLDGNNVRVCQSDGSGWDGSVPTCGKSCCFL